MQIVIDFPEADFEQICTYGQGNVYQMLSAISSGTVLPENHGRLIDADILNLYNISPVDDEYFSVYGVTAEDIDNAPTIIEGTEGKE